MRGALSQAVVGANPPSRARVDSEVLQLMARLHVSISGPAMAGSSMTCGTMPPRI
jgi:hypothetical protein